MKSARPSAKAVDKSLQVIRQLVVPFDTLWAQLSGLSLSKSAECPSIGLGHVTPPDSHLSLPPGLMRGELVSSPPSALRSNSGHKGL